MKSLIGTCNEENIKELFVQYTEANVTFVEIYSFVMGIEIRCSIHESVVLLGLQKDGEPWEPGSYVSKNSEKCPWSGDNGSGHLTL